MTKQPCFSIAIDEDTCILSRGRQVQSMHIIFEKCEVTLKDWSWVPLPTDSEPRKFRLSRLEWELVTDEVRASGETASIAFVGPPSALAPVPVLHGNVLHNITNIENSSVCTRPHSAWQHIT